MADEDKAVPEAERLSIEAQDGHDEPDVAPVEEVEHDNG